MPAPTLPNRHLLQVSVLMLFDSPFQHAITFTDDDIGSDVQGCRASGSTEWWIDCGGRMVSVGWDWVMDAEGGLSVVAANGFRTNMDLLDSAGRPLAQPVANGMLNRLTQRFDWQTRARGLRSYVVGGERPAWPVEKIPSTPAETHEPML